MRHWVGTASAPKRGHTVSQAGVRPGRTSVQLLAAGAGSQAASHSSVALWSTPSMSLSQLQVDLWQDGASNLQWALQPHTRAASAGRQQGPVEHIQEEVQALLVAALQPTWEINPALKPLACCWSHGCVLCYSTAQIYAWLCSQQHLKSLKERKEYSSAKAVCILLKRVAENMETQTRLLAQPS